MMYVRDGAKESEYDPKKVAHAARVAEELGADIVKVNYTGSIESFARVVSGVKIPVVIAGGLGYRAPTWVGAGLATVGLGLAVLSFAVERLQAKEQSMRQRRSLSQG